MGVGDVCVDVWVRGCVGEWGTGGDACLLAPLESAAVSSGELVAIGVTSASVF